MLVYIPVYMKNQFKFGQSSKTALWYFLLVVALPITTLVIGGLIYLFQQNVLLLTVAAWLTVSAVAYAALIYWPEHKAKTSAVEKANQPSESSNAHDHEALPDRLKAQSYWSTQDRDVWDLGCVAIENKLKQQTEWEALPDIALEQLSLIAEQYHGDSKNAQYRFTVPELLLVISVTSSRYRQLVIDYVPYIDKFSVANASTIFEQKANISSGYRWFNRIRRTARLINPASAVVGELRDLISDKFFSQASNALQTDLKRLLLQEVTQVGIDLYSGKLSASTLEVANYQSEASKQDQHRRADVTEPIRVLLLGQTSAGKSSLINALTETLQAEVGILPVTNRLTVHELSMEGETVISLVDTPGMDGTTEMQTQLLNAALEADLIIWLAKASQPARAPDKDLHDAIQQHYTENPQKLPAPIILTLSHIDQLSPKAEWEPPYDLDSEQAKSVSISAAVKSAQARMGLPDNTLAIPVYLGEASDHYNVDSLAAQLMMLIDTSVNVQLNRRRLELGLNAKDWRSHWAQAQKLGQVVGQSIVKRLK